MTIEDMRHLEAAVDELVGPAMVALSQRGVIAVVVLAPAQDSKLRRVLSTSGDVEIVRILLTEGLAFFHD